MEEIYERIEKVRRSFMKLMPGINSRLINPGQHSPMMNFSFSELKVLQLFKEKNRYKMSEIANSCGMPLPTATHVVEKLVKNNLVKRTPDGKDRRVIFIEFTKEGLKVMAESEIHHKENVKQFMAFLDKEDQERLVKTMEQFAGIVEEISEKIEKKSKLKEGGK